MRSLLLFVCCVLLPAEELVHDQWFTGFFEGHRAISAHERITRTADGGYRTRFEMRILIERSLGPLSSTLDFSQDRRFVEDAAGRLQSFQFDDDQNGTRVSVDGSVADGVVTATVARAGRTEQQRLDLPEGVVLYGQQGGQRLLAQADLSVGEEIVFHSVDLLGSRLQLTTGTAVLEKRFPDGKLAFTMQVDLMPIPVRVVLDAQGHLVVMRMSIGPLHLSLKPSDGPQPIEAASLDVIGLVRASGGAPQPAGSNRYRIPELADFPLPDTPFQERAGDLLTVHAEARPGHGEDLQRYLQREPQLETDDPALIAWVQQTLAEHTEASIAERAEVLRLAVRSHITRKDLSQFDASAAECFASRRGDCTEHANLLAAALRIADIPARTLAGVVYAGSLGGWGGHAWVSAWDAEQGRWLHLDAAYPGVHRSFYITTGIASGDEGLSRALQGTVGIIASEIEVLD